MNNRMAMQFYAAADKLTIKMPIKTSTMTAENLHHNRHRMTNADDVNKINFAKVKKPLVLEKKMMTLKLMTDTPEAR